MVPGVPDVVHNIEPVETFDGDDLPFFERQLLGHLAILHFVGRVVVVDPLLRVFVQHHADVVAAIRKDDSGLSVGDDTAAYLGRHLIVLPDVCAVVVNGFLQSDADLRYLGEWHGLKSWVISV